MDMNTNNQNCQCIEGIECYVNNCHYNKDSKLCTAKHIKVGPQYAVTSNDTNCATFKPE